MNQRYILIGLLILVVIIGGLYVYSLRDKQLSESVSTGTSTVNTTSDIPSDWNTYESAEYGFSLSYPKDMVFENTCTDYYENTDKNCRFSISRKESKDFSLTLNINPADAGGIARINETEGIVKIGNTERMYRIGDAVDYDESLLGYKYLTTGIPNIKNSSLSASFKTRGNFEKDFELLKKILGTFEFSN